MTSDDAELQIVNTVSALRKSWLSYPLLQQVPSSVGSECHNLLAKKCNPLELSEVVADACVGTNGKWEAKIVPT